MNVVYLVGNDSKLMNDDYPFFLTEVEHKTILETQIDKIASCEGINSIFCIRKELIKKFNLDFMIHELLPGAKVVEVNGETKGALCTTLLASHYIDNDEELLLLAINDFIDCKYENVIDYFRKNHADAGVVSFQSIHPRYSYVRLDETLNPVEFCEKKTISKNALASFYYFKEGKDLVEVAKEVIRKDNPVNNMFYLSMAYNELILLQKNIVVYQISNKLFHPLKNEMELARYITEYKNLELFK